MCLYDEPYFRFLLFQVKIEERDLLEIVKKSTTKKISFIRRSIV